ncbi:unnamed protein product [Schistocephalus solidus]|uniref:Uncharacterized protein n=1 Tax=Schistocephalus solidus TaxID=70667 RepID=A0A183TEX8_SCHSO|nr:unnamed protein product [Schistocephalus solidus]
MAKSRGPETEEGAAGAVSKCVTASRSHPTERECQSGHIKKERLQSESPVSHSTQNTHGTEHAVRVTPSVGNLQSYRL